MIISNVIFDHPVRQNCTHWLVKDPKQTCPCPIFPFAGVGPLLWSLYGTYYLGKGAETLQTLVDPPITCCACISSPWGGSIDVRKRVRRCGDVRWKTTQCARHGQYLWLSGGGGWNRNIYLEKEKLIYSISEAIQFVLKLHTYTQTSFLFIPGVRRSPQRRCFDAVNSMWGSRFLSIDTAAHYGWSVVCRQKSLFSLLPVLLISSQDPLSLIILRASPQHWLSQYLTVDFHVSVLFWGGDSCVSAHARTPIIRINTISNL